MVVEGAKMADQESSGATRVIKETFRAFVNLLKEFPKSSAGDFIYDDATIRKIKLARDALSAMDTLTGKQSPALGKEKKKVVNESVRVLSGLLSELPGRSTDEFSYDREIHLKVKEAREAIVRLGGLFP